MQMLSFRHSCLLAGLTGIVLIGCGGGGGGGGSQSGVTYVTDWSERAGAAITGSSQRVTLLRADGTVVTQQTLNFGTENRQQVKLAAPTGTYRVRVELNSAANFGGTVTGIAEASANAGETVETAVGPTLTGLRIQPSTITVGKGATLKVVASGTAAGKVAFVAPGSIAWSVEGATATVAADGTVTGVDYGPFKLKATHAASGRNVTSDAQVAVAGAVRSKWTVMVFLSAANNLYPFAIPNVNQMERVTNNDVRFVLQWKETKSRYPNATFDGTRRYLVKKDNSDNVASQVVENMGSGIDMGKPETLRDFIKWTKANYPADRYALVVWSHGNGWQADALQRPVRATSYDDEFMSAIRVWELPTALQGEHFDILSFDACLMQMLEVASEVKPFADYIAASAENTPGSGYPYDRIFSAFANDPDAPTRELLQSFVTGHIQNPPYKNQYVTQSVLDTSKIGQVETAIDNLGAALVANKDAVATAVPNIRSAAPKYGFRGDGRFYYDLVDIAERLQAHGDVPPAVKTAAQAVVTANNQAVVYSAGSTLNAFTHGLAIDFSSAANAKLSSYDRLNLAKTTRWGNWLHVAP